LQEAKFLPNDAIDPLFRGVAQATEEAILNALVAAETMTGINGNTVYALPHEAVREMMRGAAGN
jgi:L-aminopeptidase/D-esterase-like protein